MSERCRDGQCGICAPCLEGRLILEKLRAERILAEHRAWMQGELEAASAIIKQGEPHDAVMAATGLHAAYRAGIADLDRRTAAGKT